VYPPFRSRILSHRITNTFVIMFGLM
jgi:hypothetical protein